VADSQAIVYYVTSHGFGHLNRAAAVVAALPRQTRVVVKTHQNQFAAWRQSAARPCELIEGVFDCGTVHPPGESSLVDRLASLDAYERIHTAAAARLEAEVDFLRRGRFDAVVSDIAPLPLRAARSAGIPGILVANFTWQQIYEPYARRLSARHRPMVREMEQEYREASLVLQAQPSLALEGFDRVRDVGLVARRGRPRGAELRAALGIPRSTRLVYMYVGRYGQHDMDWTNLARLGGYHFVSYHAAGEARPNWHVLDPAAWPARDLAASVDVMVAKAGYGTATDAMIHRTPLVFPPRTGFAEHRVLAASLVRWGGGVPISTRDFKQLNLSRSLARATALRPPRPPWPSDGARRCADAIARCTHRAR